MFVLRNGLNVFGRLAWLDEPRARVLDFLGCLDEALGLGNLLWFHCVSLRFFVFSCGFTASRLAWLDEAFA